MLRKVAFDKAVGLVIPLLTLMTVNSGNTVSQSSLVVRVPPNQAGQNFALPGALASVTVQGVVEFEGLSNHSGIKVEMWKDGQFTNTIGVATTDSTGAYVFNNVDPAFPYIIAAAATVDGYSMDSTYVASSDLVSSGGLYTASPMQLMIPKEFVFDWVYQPDGSVSFVSGLPTSGTATVRSDQSKWIGLGTIAEVDYGSVGFLFNTATNADWNADFFSFNERINPASFWANNGSGGIHDMGAVALSAVAQAPDKSNGVGINQFYNNQSTPAVVGHTYVVVTRDGTHYAKFRLSSIADISPWTLMFYLDGDNNLDRTFPPIFNQLEAAANNPNVNVVAAWDRGGTNTSAYYKVQYDTDPNNLANYVVNVNYWPKGDLDTSDPNTLVDFVNWARATYPAQHYALILSDHGNGLGGGMVDYSSSKRNCLDRSTEQWHACLTVSDLGTALAAITNNGANKIDVLYMDMCLMGMIEDAYQVRNYVNYYVASENTAWGYWFPTPYFLYVSGISATTDPSQMATLFTVAYAGEGESESFAYTMSAADVSKLNNLVASTNSLAQALNSQLPLWAFQLKSISTSVQRFDSDGVNGIDLQDSYIDLFDFARLVKANFSDNNTQVAAQSVMDAITAYIITERHRSDASMNLDHSHGVSIFFPASGSSFYNPNNYDFAADTVWPPRPALRPRTTQDTISWGPMLVNYFQTTQPGGLDNPNPPFPLPKLGVLSNIYLPLIVK